MARPGTSPTIVYTDGACSGNPGPGGWGWVVRDGDEVGEAGFGGADETTNQRMELTAVLEAVAALDGPLHIVSDSTYVVNCFRDSWWQGWLKRDWRNSQKKPVANRDLWEPLIEHYRARDITFEWVKGHSGDPWNDRADELAVRGRQHAVGEVQPEPPADHEPDRPVGVRSIAIVGHRPPELGGYGDNPVAASVRRRIGEILEAKRELHPDLQVLTGLGLGVEQLGAEAAIEAGVPFVAVLAFPDPAARWPRPSQEHFDRLLDQALDVVIVDRTVPKSTAQAAKAFASRDRRLQADADEAIVVFDGRDRVVGAQARAFEQALGDEVWILDPRS